MQKYKVSPSKHTSMYIFDFEKSFVTRKHIYMLSVNMIISIYILQLL